MPQQRGVVLTGAAGLIGRSVSQELADAWRLRLTDKVLEGPIETLDVTDLDACRKAFAGADAVVHLAAVPDPEATWEQLLPANVVGAYTVARAAMDAGVRRLVLASSLQAVAGLPEHAQRRATDQARPANLYGATKAWAEALGSWVAATSRTSVVALRLGYFPGRRLDVATTPVSELSAWLSARDAVGFLRGAVEAEVEGFLVANVTSANRHRVADLHGTEEALGYQPVGGAWTLD
ncbi:NAD-dependent epimerase/dehydratase family protein [Aquipuribacter hungaricus]|uniref:NAD-dependent epimerase/dehydratase family protein n=1 Tax=Aquipuribacter hungaricus TaxID=545624 RepID=A0ABV7WK42_9MICO